MNPDESNDPNLATATPVTQPVAQSAANSNRKLILTAASIIGLLLVILIILLALVLGKKDKTVTTTNSANPSTSSSSGNSANSKTAAMKIIKTVPTSNPKLEILIYEPKQTGSNTTINYSIRNSCTGCQESTYASFAELSAYPGPNKIFLLDDTAGQKYNPIVDQDNNVLMTPSCGGNLKAGQKLDCFIAFTKVPAGTSVSLVAGQLKIDDILVN